MAYLLAKNAWGQGLATEAAIASVHYGFETAALERIIGLVHPENIASARVLEKCGMAFRDDLHLWGIDLRRYQVDRPGREAAR